MESAHYLVIYVSKSNQLARVGEWDGKKHETEIIVISFEIHHAEVEAAKKLAVDSYKCADNNA